MLRYDEIPSISKFSSTNFRNIIATMMHICENIKKGREMRKLSQDELSSKLGVKRTTYAEWEKETVPRADTFWRLATILKVKPDDLLSENWQPDENSTFTPVATRKKISLETIQKDLDTILSHQVTARAEIRAYGQYQATKDAKGDQNQIVKILGVIGTLVAEHEANILKEGMRADADR